jgi:ribulose 1,5-bisphosphate synthetase/thiazole synthase
MGSVLSIFSGRDQSNADIKAAIEVPVLIVGGGPSGVLQALLLSRLGGKYPENKTSLIN